MRLLLGEATRGYGLAARNLAHVAPLITARTGLTRMISGTLNVRLPEPYLVPPESTVSVEEYDGHEYLKLQRCVVHGIRAVIVRPHKHETVPGWAHGPTHVELVSAVHLRSALALHDGAALRIEVEGGWAWWARAGVGDARLLQARVRRYVRRVSARHASARHVSGGCVLAREE